MKGAAKSTGLDEWIAEVSADSRTGPASAWEKWPPEFLADVTEVLRRNDASAACVSLAAMLQWGARKYGLKITRSQIETALHRKFSRKSWTRP
jgi:hypothetical protein